MQDICIEKNQLRIHDIYSASLKGDQTITEAYKVPSAYCSIVLSSPKQIRIITIVTKRIDINHEKECFHYTEKSIRYLLTALFLNEATVQYNGENFVIQNCFYTDLKENSFRFLLPSESLVVETKRNGGYYEARKHLLQIDGLVFCEKSNCLEIMHMSYDPEFDIYYVDRHVYNDFLDLYGYPIIDNYAEHDFNNFRRLQPESLLHQLGYNVNKNENLSMSARQSMLARFVDLGFIDVSSIVSLLQSLIQRNGMRSPSSCEKWKDDLEFIKNYRIDHERFAFVHYVRAKS